jgi:hypothetical protein
MIRLLACVLLLTGCAAAPYKSPVPTDAARTVSVDNGQTLGEMEIEQKLTEALDFCLPILSGYERESATRAKWAFGLKASGLVIGAVVVPALTASAAAANAAWIAAGAGYAGAVPFASDALESAGLSGKAHAETRNAIVRELTQAIAVATDGSLEMEQRRAALLRVRSSCVVYSITVPTIPAD